MEYGPSYINDCLVGIWKEMDQRNVGMSEVFGLVHILIFLNLALVGIVITLYFWKRKQQDNTLFSLVATVAVLVFLQIFRGV